MASIADQIAKYFVDSGDIAEPGESVPHTSAGNTVTPLVDGDNYFGALRLEVDALKASSASGRFFYFANWWLGLVEASAVPGAGGSGPTAWSGATTTLPAFKLNDERDGPYPDFIDELAALRAANVDVRALVWVSPVVMSGLQHLSYLAGMHRVNAYTLLSAAALRNKPGLATNVCLDILAHPLGAMHLKMVLCGDDSAGARAYVAGLDFVDNRIDGPTHPGGAPREWEPRPRVIPEHDTTWGWHDAGAKIDGPAVQGVYDYYRALWNEVKGRNVSTFRIGDVQVPTWTTGTVEVPARTFPTSGTGTMHVQVLRTGPKLDASPTGVVRTPVTGVAKLFDGFFPKPWSFAPDGIFEFEPALKKAIDNAKRYIYVEDQGFLGQPIMDWLHARLEAEPNLKLIMVHHADPADGAGAPQATATAINQHLCAGSTANRDAQVAFYERTDRVIVHSKTWIIDDEYLIVGSANCYRRSLYTDAETSIGVLDEVAGGDDAAVQNVAVQYRLMLWGEHCMLDAAADRKAALLDVTQAIRIWDDSWTLDGAPPPAPSSPPAELLNVFQRKKVPFEQGTAPDQFTDLSYIGAALYDISDADSRLW